MSLLQIVEPEQAQGEVANIYQILTQSIGVVPNAMKISVLVRWICAIPQRQWVIPCTIPVCRLCCSP